MQSSNLNSLLARATPLISWLIILWVWYVFLGSLPYKFTNHPDTQHIFGTIGAWLGSWLGGFVGQTFTDLGAYVVGAFELLTSLVLLSPAVLWLLRKAGVAVAFTRAQCHQVGGLMAAGVMTGAVFFHLFTPLGIVVLHQGQSDGGSLFFAAVSILLLGLVMFWLNRRVA